MPIQADATSYSVLDFLKWQTDGTLQLRPPFQRGAVWRPVQKSALIDSVLRGYPIPALFLQDRSEPDTFKRQLVVIDGQQRLRTILSYVDPTSLPDRDERDEFSLLAIHDPDRAGQTFAQLAEGDKHQILGTRLNVYIVSAIVPEGEILEVFRRMNTYGARLNRQELRNAKWSGVFKEVSYRLAADAFDYWLKWGLFNRQTIAEMADAEFTSDLLLLVRTGVQATNQDALDKAYKDFDAELPEADSCVQRFHDILGLIDEVFEQGPRVRRLRTKMWTYSLFAVLQDLRYGGPVVETPDAVARDLDVEAIKAGALEANRRIEASDLPEDVDRARRGAANDASSRRIRSDFLRDLLDAA
jgi:hypothetical protein